MKNAIQQPIARFCRTYLPTIGWLLFYLTCFVALSHLGHSRSHYSHSHSNRGGHYSGGVGSSHKGGHYVNRFGGDGYLGY